MVICGALRVDRLVAAPDDADTYTIKTLGGSRRAVKRFVAEHALAELMPKLIATAPNEQARFRRPIRSCTAMASMPLRDPRASSWARWAWPTHRAG